MKDNCCDELLACEADEDCSCIAACVDEGGFPIQCAQECGVNGINQTFQSLGTCTNSNCFNVCS